MILKLVHISKIFHSFVYFSYKNVTKDLKLEWYNFQLEANEVVDEWLGPILDPLLEGDEEEKPDRPYRPTIEKNDDYDDG